MKFKQIYVDAVNEKQSRFPVPTCDPRAQHTEVRLQSVLKKSESLKIEGMKEKMGKREKNKKKEN